MEESQPFPRQTEDVLTTQANQLQTENPASVIANLRKALEHVTAECCLLETGNKTLEKKLARRNRQFRNLKLMCR